MTKIQELRDWSAEKIMGWYRKGNNDHYWWCSPSPDMPDNTYNREYFGLWKADKESWLPDIPSSGQIWLVVETLYTVHHWSLRLNLTYPAIGDGEKGARVYLYSGRTYCEYKEKKDPWDSIHPNPYVAIQSPKSTPFITNPNPCIAMLKAAKAAWDGNVW